MDFLLIDDVYFSSSFFSFAFAEFLILWALWEPILFLKFILLMAAEPLEEGGEILTFLKLPYFFLASSAKDGG